VDASARAAQVAREIRNERARISLDATTIFSDLGVMVKDGDVIRTGQGKRGYLGPLLGACAGIMDIHPPSGGQIAASVVFGGNPRVGTIFVAVADGSRHELPLQQGTRPTMHRIDQQIAQFNALADAAAAAARQPQAATHPDPEPLTKPVAPADLTRDEHIAWLDAQSKALQRAVRENIASRAPIGTTTNRYGVQTFPDPTALREQSRRNRTLLAWRKELIDEKKTLERQAKHEAKAAARTQRKNKASP
jgi:hypothetical protein